MAVLKTLAISLLFLHFCGCKVWKDVGNTFKFLRDSPRPDDRREVITVDVRDELLHGPNREADPAKTVFNEARKRAKRSSTRQPRADFVSFRSIAFPTIHWILLFLFR